MMELEAEEMLFTGDMKEKLWVKSLDKNQYKQLMDEESQARKETLDKMIRAWEEAQSTYRSCDDYSLDKAFGSSLRQFYRLATTE